MSVLCIKIKDKVHGRVSLNVCKGILALGYSKIRIGRAHRKAYSTCTPLAIQLLEINMATSADGFKSKEIFDTISKSLAEDGKTLVGKVKGIYGFKVKGGPDNKEGFWIVDAKNGLGSVEFNGKG